MNIGMELNKSDDENIIIYQNKIQDILLNLRDKRRKSRDPEDEEFDHLSDKWNRYNRSYFLSSVQKSTEKCDVYPLHEVLELCETDEQMEEMLKHLSQLQRLAYEYVDIIFFYIFLKLYFISLFFVTEIHAKWET